MTLVTTRPEARKAPGRPRSERADRDILKAALDLFGEVGFEALTIEGVAERAGVGKTTVYRRWASKAELVSAAVGTLSAELRLADTGSTRDDLVDLVRQMIRLLTSEPAGRVLPHIAGEIASGSSVGRMYVRTVLGPRREIVAEAVRRGVERGDLRPELDGELAVDQIMGPVIVRRMLGGPIAPPPRDLAERVVDGALRGLAEG